MCISSMCHLTAIIQIKEGTDTDTALKDAEDQLNQLMGK